MNRVLTCYNLLTACVVLLAVALIHYKPIPHCSSLKIWTSHTDSVTLLHPRIHPSLSSGSTSQQPIDVRVGSSRKPDVTAVILNWSRYANVLKIAASLCSDALEDTIAGVSIFNNSPKKISFEDFHHDTGCPRHKLQIFNSPSNLLFEARFIACAQVSSVYCFIQDDDYLILPEIVWTMRSMMAEDNFEQPNTIHLGPAHEQLSTSLRRTSLSSDFNTSFTWLGYGTMLPRIEARSFLQLLHQLNFSKAERAMADNYFTILKNAVPETWFDQGIELGGGQPFTVGPEGDDRNHAHILKAAGYVESMVLCDGTVPCTKSSSGSPDLPYVKSTATRRPVEAGRKEISRAPCVGTTCLLTTSVNLLPDVDLVLAAVPSEMLEKERQNMRLLGDMNRRRYLESPLSYAVDAKQNTSFCVSSVKQGDFISLDALRSLAPHWTNVEMVWLVNAEAAKLLISGSFQYSIDDMKWLDIDQDPRCSNSVLRGPLAKDVKSQECMVNVPPAGRSFRTVIAEDDSGLFCFHEVWLQGTSQ